MVFCLLAAGCAGDDDNPPTPDSAPPDGPRTDGPRSDGPTTDSHWVDGPHADLSHADGPAHDGSVPSGIWATAYYAGWMQGTLPPDKIDYAALTHVIHFALVVKSDGTLDDQGNGVTAASATAAVQAAHAAGRTILISVGGAGSAPGFRGATKSATRAAFIANIVQLVSSRGYDGVDLDWEPLEASDEAQLVALVQELRAALDKKSVKLLLTAAVAWRPALIAKVHTLLDQINVMTYDMSGAWPGWVTWHNAPIYDGGCTFQSTGKPVPSADAQIGSFIAAGIPVGKLGIGIDFYGYVWSGGAGTSTGGVTQPCQAYTSDPAVQSNLSYAQIMDTHYKAQHRSWDSGAEAVYLSIDNAGSANDKFISYDDETTVAKKVGYAKVKGLGGVFIWELGGGYRTSQPAGQRDPLLQALKQALP